MELIKDIILDNLETIIVATIYFVGGVAMGAAITDAIHRTKKK